MKFVHGSIDRSFDPYLVRKLDLPAVPKRQKGRFDVIHSKYTNEEESLLNIKHDKECRLGLGVAIVISVAQHGTVFPAKGQRYLSFNYI